MEDWTTESTEDIQHDLAMLLADGEDGEFEAGMKAELARRGKELSVRCHWVFDVYARGKRRLVYEVRRVYVEMTEADDARSKHEALVRVSEYARAYFRGEETIGVLAMYEEAAHKWGVPWHVIWETVAKARNVC